MTTAPGNKPAVQQYQLFAVSFLAVAFGAMDSVLSSAYLPDIIRDLAVGVTDKEDAGGLVGSWINFSFLAGGTLGGIGLGFLSDRIGRRAVLLWALLSYGLGSGLGAVSASWELLACTRVLVGAGVGAALVVTAVMISEVWPERNRAVALGILSVAYPVGVILSGVVTAFITDWRKGFLLGASALLLLAPVRWLMPGNIPRVKTNASAKQEALSDYRTTLIAGILVYGTMLIGLWATFSWLPTWVQSLIGPESAEGQSARGLSVALLGGGGLIGGIVSGFLSNRLGSRQVQAACFIICLLLSYYLFQCQTGYGTPATVGIAALGICFGISQGVLNEYIPGLFPSALRSSATGLCFHTGRAFTAVAVFFVGAFVVWFGGYGNAIFAFSLVYLVGLMALWWKKTT